MTDLSEDEVTLLAIKGAISELSTEDRRRCDDLATEIRSMVKKAGDVGVLVIALLGAELQMDDGS